jgi:hypothetical protein
MSFMYLKLQAKPGAKTMDRPRLIVQMKIYIQTKAMHETRSKSNNNTARPNAQSG